MLISMRALPEEQIDPTGRGALRASQFCAEHAAQLITQLLSLNRGIDQETSSIDLGDVIRKAVTILRSTFPQSIKIEVVVRPDLHLIAGNTTQLYQLLLNLCLNARDAMPRGGTLIIETGNAVLDEIEVRSLPGAVPGEYVLLSLADTGDGIPDEIVGKIFEPFFTTKNDSENTGLGLFAVADIIKNHRGFINLTSAPRRGTRFLIYLPAQKPSF
jgi:signal transduction histidine kinase